MEQRDREMIQWWKKNDRVTLSIATSGPERLEWAKGCNSTVRWLVAGGSAWAKCTRPEWMNSSTYRIDPAYQIPEEPVSPWEEEDVVREQYPASQIYLFWRGSDKWSIDLAIRIPGFGGILWRDDIGDADDKWRFVPQGIDDDGDVTGDSDHWVRPCRPVKVRFWRGA